MAVSRLFIAVALAPALIVACQPATTNQASATPASTPKATFQVWSEDPGRRLAPADFGLPEQDVVIADPAIAHLPDGRLRMYVRAGTRGRSNLYSALSSDGLTWKVEPGIRCTQSFCFNSLPDVVALPSGGWRLFFNQHSGTGAPDQTAIITSATTTDGLTFTPDTGVRVRGTDFHLNRGYELDSPRVIALPGGGWRMYLSESSPGYSPSPPDRVFSAHSTDSLAWTPDPGVRMQGVTRPSVVLKSDGTYEAFAASSGQQGAALQCVCIGLLTSTDGLVWSTPRMVGVDGGDLVAYAAPDGQVHLVYDDGDIYPPATTGLFGATLAKSTWRVEVDSGQQCRGSSTGRRT